MRRIIFYIIVAFLAFVAGSFIASNFYHNSEVSVRETLTEIKITDQNVNEKMPGVKFRCDDEATRTIWQELEKDEDFIKNAYPVIEAWDVKNCQELFDRYSANLKDDTPNEIILKGNYILLCGSAGVYRTWIVSKFGGEYRIIFDRTFSESADTILFLQKTSHNFKDIKVRLNNGLENDNIGIFKFDGEKYRVKNCFVDENSDFKTPFDDEVHNERLVSVNLNKCL